VRSVCNERGRVKTLLERLRPELVKTGWMPPELQEPDPHQFINLGPGARRRGTCSGRPGRREARRSSAFMLVYTCPPLGSCCYSACAGGPDLRCIRLCQCVCACSAWPIFSLVAMANGQSVEHAMQYLQEVEKELPERDFAEFLNVIEEFKSNRCLAGAFPALPLAGSCARTRGRACPPTRGRGVPHSAPSSAHIPHSHPRCCRGHLRGRLAESPLPLPARALPETGERERASERAREDRLRQRCCGPGGSGRSRVRGPSPRFVLRYQRQAKKEVVTRSRGGVLKKKEVTTSSRHENLR